IRCNTFSIMFSHMKRIIYDNDVEKLTITCACACALMACLLLSAMSVIAEAMRGEDDFRLDLSQI
ncbi:MULTISPECIES: hypothetical protein, partial [unclassified Halomonas]|uniref:hypothetical protein n=1 Tax=unclassified Halomonas TaxID=2609666 RepID=UPI004034598C